MPPRLPLILHSSSVACTRRPSSLRRCLYASLATAITPAPSIEQMTQAVSPISHHPPTQPPSHKRPEYRKSQLLRQYTSLLRSTPLILIWQHNNLKAVEWMSIRRELEHALHNVDQTLAAAGASTPYAPDIKLQIVRTTMLKPALKIVHFHKPAAPPTQHPTDPRTTSSAQIPNATPAPEDPAWTHSLSRRAHDKTFRRKLPGGMDALLTGSIALTTFPAVTPQHLAAVLSILAPSKQFPAPKRRVRPTYYDPHVQTGLQKLFLLAARIEGKIFDEGGVKWVGGIQGGLDGLRAQLVAMLTGVGGQVTSTLESASRSLYFTMEGRRGLLEDEEKKGDEKTPSS